MTLLSGIDSYLLQVQNPARLNSIHMGRNHLYAVCRQINFFRCVMELTGMTDLADQNDSQEWVPEAFTAVRLRPAFVDAQSCTPVFLCPTSSAKGALFLEGELRRA